MMTNIKFGLAFALILAMVAGCATSSKLDSKGKPKSSELAEAELLFNQGNYDAALIKCVDVAHKDPLTPGLADLRYKIVAKINDLREDDAVLRAKAARETMTTEADGKKAVPDTYGLRRFSQGDESSLRALPTATELLLQKPVTLDVQEVDLIAVVAALVETAKIPIILDKMENLRPITIHAENVPLGEILDFVTRNMGVEFFLGENVIWVTAPQQPAAPGVPLITRLYRLRKGDPGLPIPVSSTESGPVNVSMDDYTGHAKLLDALDRFVPKVEGADHLYDNNAHILIMRNTRANLAKAEEIIEALDITPPQVLIEARFVTVSVNDLRELGIDWLLNSPINVTYAAGKGQTEISKGASASYTPSVNNSQGLNLTYKGILSDPLFQATMHALEISGKSRTLSVPRITTMNNHIARIHVGENYPYYTKFKTVASTETITLAGGTQSNVVRWLTVPDGDYETKDLGITLDVIPSVGADMRSINLALHPSITSHERDNEYKTIDETNASMSAFVRLPIFNERDIQTKMVVQSGETVVMGGLIQVNEVKEMRTIPILGRIPLLGNLFSYDKVKETKENLLIFVTATIISEHGEDLIPIHRSPKLTGRQTAVGVDQQALPRQ